jgi:hypothetical protein
MGRRTGVVGIVPGDDAVARPVGAIHPEQNDERAVPGALHEPGSHGAVEHDPGVGLPDPGARHLRPGRRGRRSRRCSATPGDTIAPFASGTW